MRLDPAASGGTLIISAGLKWNEPTAEDEKRDDECGKNKIIETKKRVFMHQKHRLAVFKNYEVRRSVNTVESKLLKEANIR